MFTKRKRSILIIFAGALALASLAIWFLQRHGRQTVRFRVNRDEGFLVVACHELQYNAITETGHEDGGGCEVTTTPPGGQFALSLPKGGMGAHPATHLTISKPGFEIHEGTFKPEESDPYDYRPDDDGVLQINISPTTSYREEALANIRALPREYESLDAAQKRTVDQYLAAREADLAKRYPTEVAEAKARRALRSFRLRQTLPTGPLALAALPNDGLVALLPGRELIVLDAEQKMVNTTALSGRREATFARGPNYVAVFDAGAIRLFDYGGKPLKSIALHPVPDRAEQLALTSDGFVLALGATPEKPPRLCEYSGMGELQWQRERPAIDTLKRLLVSPDGSILLFGQLDEDFNPDVFLGEMKKYMHDVRDQNGIIYLARWDAKPDVILRGIDSVVADGDQVLAYADALYHTEDEALVEWGVTGYLHQLLLEVSWDGQIRAKYDISDGAVHGVQLGQPLGDRLVFYRYEDIYELVRSKLPAAAP